MSSLSRQVAGLGLLAMACAVLGMPAAARADESGAMAALPQNMSLASSDSSQAPPAIDGNMSMKIDPMILAAADAPASGGVAPAGAPATAPSLEQCPPGVHTPPPLPLFNIEGMGGTLLVPMAYPLNCESAGTTVGMPSFGYTFVRAGTKTVHEFHYAQTFYRRFTIGYTFGVLDMGDFPGAVKRSPIGIDIGFQHSIVHNFNLSAKIIDESQYVPAVMAGVTFKYNPNVQAIDRRLHGGIAGLGLARSNGVDYTLTATKTFIDPLFNRPLMLTGGVRFSNAAQLGYLGFGDAYRMTGEGSIVYMPTDWFAIAYEYRQKKNPYRTLGTLVGREGAWQAVDFAFIITPKLTFAMGWLCAGNVANGRVDNGWGIQLKYEF
jgi:hypothetical protein